MPQLHCYESCKQCQNIQWLNALEDDDKTQRREHKFPGFPLIERLHNLHSRPGTAVFERFPDEVSVRHSAGQSTQQRRLGSQGAVQQGQQGNRERETQLKDHDPVGRRTWNASHP